MSEYRDITCDPFGGTRAIDLTAKGILDVLTVSTGAVVNHAAVDGAILAAGGRLNWKAAAVKALRNMGWTIDVEPGRHLTTYRLAGTPDEMETYRQRVMREVYSRTVTIGRTLNGQMGLRPHDPIVVRSFRTAELLAITLAGDPAINKTAAEAIADLVPL